MARLSGDQGQVVLSSRTLVGRSDACRLRLSSPLVSGEHATIHHNGHAWLVRDLGSKNGTFVNGQRIEAGAAMPIDLGATIGFGQPQGWTLEDASPPGAVAETADGRSRAEEVDGILALPDADHPEASVFQGRDGVWVLERAEGAVEEVESGDLIEVAGQTWRLDLPGVLEGTPLADGPSLETVRFRFRISRNEEHVELELHHHGNIIPLDAHEHYYVLLTLARLRERDSDLPVAERGWIDREELVKMLAMSPNALDVSICRARKKLTRAGVEGAVGVVEVRPRQRRFGTDNFEIRTL